jgi:hypothetical protein
MVLSNFFKLIVWIGDKKYDYYGSICDYLEFNDKLKHEIIWKKQDKKSNVSVAEGQPLLFF